MHHLHESELFLLTGAIKISLLSFYLSLLLAKATGRFIWEFSLHRSGERAQIWGLGTTHCLWDHGTEITRQFAANSKLFKGMINVLPLLFLLEPSQLNQSSSTKSEYFLWCVGDVGMLYTRWVWDGINHSATGSSAFERACEGDGRGSEKQKASLGGLAKETTPCAPKEMCGAAWL